MSIPIVSKMKTKNNFIDYNNMVLGLKTRKLALAGHLAGGKHNTLPASPSKGSKTSGDHKMRACGMRIGDSLGEPGQGK